MSLTTEILSLPEAANLWDEPQPRDADHWHVTDLINEAAKVINPKYHYPDDHTENGIMALGRIWECAIRPYVEDKAVSEGYKFSRQVIVSRDDVIGTTDGILEPKSHKGKRKVVEIKSRHSSPADPTHHWRWMAQVKAYCAITGCTEAWMPVLYLPKSPPDAVLLLHRLKFTDKEIDDWWTILLSVKESLDKGIKNDD